MPKGHSLSINDRFSGKKRTSMYVSREKGLYIHFFLVVEKNETEWVRKDKLLTIKQPSKHFT